MPIRQSDSTHHLDRVKHVIYMTYVTRLNQM